MLEVLKVSRKNTGGCIRHIWWLLLTVGRVVDDQSWMEWRLREGKTRTRCQVIRTGRFAITTLVYSEVGVNNVL